VARHENAPEVPVFLKGAGAWTKEKLEEGRARVSALARTRGAVEPIERHPWRGCGLTAAPYERQLEIRKRIDEFLKQHAEFWKLLHELAAELEAPPRPSFTHDQLLIELAKVLFNSPRPEPALLDDPRWTAPGAVEGARIIRWLTEYAAARDALLPRYDPALLEAEVEPLHDGWLRHGDSLFRFVRPTFWKARGLLKRLRKPGVPAGDALKDLDLAVKARRAAGEIGKADGTLFGARWRGLDSSIGELTALHVFLAEFGAAIRAGVVSDKIRRLAATGMPRRPLPDANAYEEARQALQSILEMKLADQPGAGEPQHQEAAARAGGMRDGMERLEEWTRYRAALQEASTPELAEFVKRLEGVAPASIEAAFERQFFRSWLEEVLPQRPRVARLDAAEHDRLVATFAEVDRRVIELNRKRARAELLGRLPDPAWEASPGSDLGLLQREVYKKRGHAPLRKLFSAIPRTLVRVKPCLMMSPLSVAQFLEPAAEPFDLVVFDEASQIAPEDAVGTIARARQLVVVGDPKQLPPTPFFHVEAPDAEGAEEAEIAEGDLESVLDECASIFPERRMLRWHYRSRDEDLIAFSNRAYYDGRLVTFPSPARAADRPAVEFVHVPDGVYDRGGTGMNRVEAERVAKAVFDQLKAQPDRSVGVGAFSVKQQQAVEDALERLRRADPSLEARFDAARDEFCFVKNLETIQGDERDVIFLSIGYGKDAAGGMSVNFGPLNQEGGARRLNVLVTRAREKVYVFSSIQPEQIDLSRTESAGVRNLRKYLEYAKRGPEAQAGEAPDEPPGGVERAIEEALTARGLAIERGVGRSEYRLDLAVREGDRRLLGVECDGPAYQGGATARDRDRLRRQVLESLGWRLHRLWSPSYIRQPQRELARIVEEVERAKAGRPVVQPEVRIEAVAPAAVASTGPEATPYRLAAVKFLGRAEEFFAVPVDRIAEVLGYVVSCEGPIHVDEAARRVAAHWEIPRLSPKVFDIIQSASWRCQKAKRFEQRGPFYWPAGMAEAPVRRRETDDAPRDAELIAPEEIAQATLLVLAKEFRVREDELTDRAARILGFTRTGPKVRESVAAALGLLRRSGRVTDGEWIERVKR
jgi:very-short-patch-repair endonuclease